MLAINDDFHFLSLSKEQRAGQEPWFFNSDLENLKKYHAYLKNKIPKLELAVKLVEGKHQTTQEDLKKKNPQEQAEIHLIIERYKGDHEKLKKVLSDQADNYFIVNRALETQKNVHRGNRDTYKQNDDWHAFFN